MSGPAAAEAELTQQQRSAIQTRDVSVALSAGAGCGKTFVLTRRFLSHLEPGPNKADLSNLVAITFTERAAREMRTRIRQECARRLKTCSDADAPHWLKLVRQLDGARISTFHAFCMRLLQTNAALARLDPRFAPLPELSSAACLRNAVQSTVRQRLSQADQNVMDLVYEFGMDQTEALLERLVLQRYRIDFDEWSDVPVDDLVGRWKVFREEVVVPSVLSGLRDGTQRRNVAEVLERHAPPRTPAARQKWDALCELLPRLDAAADPAELLDEIRESLHLSGLSKSFDAQTYQQIEERWKSFKDQIDRCGSLLTFDATHAERSAELGLAALRVCREAGAAYDRHKADAGGIDFDDQLLRARDLLRDHPEVRTRVAAGISLLLVDEFQDTDPIQTEIVRMLCGDALLQGKLFFVGDHKQSIYRFRRADPQVFHQLRGEVPDDGRLPLTRNFRSQPAILKLVNAVFDDVLGPEYEPLVPHLPQLSPEPIVEFLFPLAADSNSPAATTESPEAPGIQNPKSKIQNGAADDSDDEDLSPADCRRKEARWIARRLACLLGDGVPRVRECDKATGEHRLRPAKPKDMVLLFRAMSDVRYYEEALRKEDLPYYVIGGRAFYSQQEVYDVANLLQALDDPQDQISLLGVLRSPFFSLSDDAVFAMWHESRDFLTALDRPPPACLSETEQTQVAYASRVLADLREHKDRLPLHELLERAIDRTGYDAALLAEFLGERKLANLRKLLEMARQFDRSGQFTLADFVVQLRGTLDDEAREPLAATHPESSDVIRLMTIHQAKGLEFPITVVVDMDRPANRSTPAALFHPRLGPLVRLGDAFGEKRDNPALRLHRLLEESETLAETLRLLYVAMTRAADLLILSGCRKNADKLDHPWMQLLASRFDLQTGQPRQTLLVGKSRELPQIRVHEREPEHRGRSGPLRPSPEAGRFGHGERGIGLARLREAVLAAEPSDPPEPAKPVPVDPLGRLRFNVSQIEVADAELDALFDAAVSPFASRKDALSRSERRHCLPPIELLRHGVPCGMPPLVDREPEYLGTLAHAVLERMDLSRPGDISALVATAVLSLQLDVPASVCEAAIHAVAGFLKSPLAAEVASARAFHRELEFLLHWPARETARLVTGSIDGLCETAAGEWLLFDYKTKLLGADSDAESILRDYEIQLGLYCLAARQFIGRLPDRVELVLIRDGVQRLTIRPTDDFLAAVSRRVDAAMEHLGTSAGTR